MRNARCLRWDAADVCIRTSGTVRGCLYACVRVRVVSSAKQ